MRVMTIVLGCLALLFGTAAGLVVAQELVVVVEEWPPYRIPDDDGPAGFGGIDMDLLAYLEGELGVVFRVERHPFARALEMIRTGQGHVITGIARTDERAEYIAYVPTSYSEVRPVFYTQRGRGKEIRTYDDLYGLSVGYSLNSAYFEPFNSDTRLTKVGVSTERQLLQMVALGRLDVTIGTDPNISYDASRYGLSDRVEPTMFVPEPSTPLYLGLSPRSTAVELMDEFDAAIRRLVESGGMKTIQDRYR